MNLDLDLGRSRSHTESLIAINFAIQGYSLHLLSEGADPNRMCLVTGGPVADLLLYGFVSPPDGWDQWLRLRPGYNVKGYYQFGLRFYIATYIPSSYLLLLSSVGWIRINLQNYDFGDYPDWLGHRVNWTLPAVIDPPEFLSYPEFIEGKKVLNIDFREGF